jgi:hypothetical protein
MTARLPLRCRRIALGLAGTFLLVLCASAGVASFADEPDVPDVGEPFDFKAFEAYSLSAEKNADSSYLRAQKFLFKFKGGREAYARRQATEKSVRQAALVGWGEANADARGWLARNEEALDIWKTGTAQAEAIEVPLREMGFESLLPVSNDARVFAALALLKSSRLTSEGHMAEAWSWYRATLRNSRHLGMHGGIVERMVGADVYRLARDPILNWAARPEVNAADLRQALADAVAVDSMTAPLARTLKVEYLSARHSIPLVLANLRKEHPFVAAATRQSGRPEKMVRVANYWFSNWLANAERPRWQRKPMSDKMVGLFEPDPGSPKPPPARELKKIVAMQLSGLERNMGVISSPVVDYALPGMMSLFDMVDEDRVNRAAVSVGLALQLYFREHGRFPAEPTQAGYLKSLPLDPFGKGEAIHYRLVGTSPDHAVVWSVGPAGINQAGEPPSGAPGSESRPETVFEIKAFRESHSGK